MFTGIVSAQGEIAHIDERDNAKSFLIRFPLKFGLNIKVGASIAINGVCLTVVDFIHVMADQEINQEELNSAILELLPPLSGQDYVQIHFDVISTTLNLTNLSEVTVGSKVNAERSYRVGDEIGGHILSGHIDNKIQIVNLIDADNIYQLEFALPDQYRHLVVDKGFVGIDGMSLTVSSITDKGFTVNLIPETLAVTTIGSKKVGDYVNLEIDNQTKVITQAVETLLKARGIIS